MNTNIAKMKTSLNPLKFLLLTLTLLIFCIPLNAQWTPVAFPGTDNLVKVSFMSPNVGFAATRNFDLNTSSPLLKTLDGGISWDSIVYPIPANRTRELISVQFVDQNHGYIMGQTYDTTMVFPISESFVLKSTDGGGSWADVTPSLTLFSPRFYFTDADNGVVAGTEELYHTTDGGISWDSIPVPNIGPFSLSFGTANVGYAAGFELSPSQTAWISKTTDGGTTWNNVSIAPTNSNLIRTSFFIDADHGYVFAENNNYILYTADGGQTWTQNSFTLGPALDAWFVNDSTGYCIVEDKIWKTMDYGANWTLDFQDPQNRNFEDLEFSGDQGFASGQNGLLVTIDLATGLETIQEASYFQMWPNPAGTSGTLHWKLPVNSHFHLEIRDVTGTIWLLRELKSNHKTVTVELNSLNLSPGAYCWKITLPSGQVGRGKMILR